MKNFLVGASVCVAAMFGVDSYFFHGKYYNALISMGRQIYQHVR